MDLTRSFSKIFCFSSIARSQASGGLGGDLSNARGNAVPAVFETLPSEALNTSLVDLGILLVWVILLIQCAFPDFRWPPL